MSRLTDASGSKKLTHKKLSKKKKFKYSTAEKATAAAVGLRVLTKTLGPISVGAGALRAGMTAGKYLMSKYYKPNIGKSGITKPKPKKKKDEYKY